MVDNLLPLKIRIRNVFAAPLVREKKAKIVLTATFECREREKS